MQNHVVIMAGGIGSRFWPLSTPEFPKQFIDILGCGRTLIQLTVDRFKGVCPDENFWVVTNAKYVDIVKQQLPMIPENHIWLGEFSEGSLDEGITKFLEQEDLPDGIFCSSDVIAARLIRIALTKGISVPRQIRVIGFDNIDIAEYIGLTSVNQNLEESGRMAARLILMRIKDRERGSVVMKVPLSVIERETTGR